MLQPGPPKIGDEQFSATPVRHESWQNASPQVLVFLYMRSWKKH